MKIKRWLINNTLDLTDKTIAVTGSTGDLASILVEYLAALNANLILINRDKEKTTAQIAKLKSINPNLNIELVLCDLAKFSSVVAATEILKEKNIDILYLAAGAYNIPRHTTDIGFDNIFQINFLSHYYMVNELKDKIKAVDGKIVAISSIAYTYSKLNKNDIDFSKHKKHSKVYGNAKRFLMLSLQQLCEQENINLAIVHPGVTLTEMTNHYPKAINWLVKVIIKLIFPSTKKASLSLLKGLFSNTQNLEWIGPKYFNIWGCPKNNKLSKNLEQESKKIFKIAEEINIKVKKINLKN